MSWADLSGFFALNWGNVASVLGLAVSLVTLAVASKAREAAEAAKAMARSKSVYSCLNAGGTLSGCAPRKPRTPRVLALLAGLRSSARPEGDLYE